MKKNLLFFVFLLINITLLAQEIDKTKAMQLVSSNSAQAGLSANDLENSIVSNAYVSSVSGVQLVYLQQSYKGIPVFNQLKVLAFKNGSLVSGTGERIADIEKKTSGISSMPSVAAESAVLAALASKKVFVTASLVKNTLVPGKKYDFGKAGVSQENITAELIWVPVEDGRFLRLAWQVYLVPVGSSDYWMIRINAHNNQLINENNLTVYCNWDETTGQGPCTNTGHRNHVLKTAANISKNNHKGIFDFTGSRVASRQVSGSPLVVGSANYRVIPFPAESPKHPGGSHALVSNPWTAAPGNATSLNWHSNGTSDFNYTRGNNVWAQEDVNGNNGTGISAISSTSPDPLNFDFTPDFNLAPGQTTAAPNQQFHITNLFYWNNIIHDISYIYGFDEVAGNFQANNQGRGGAGNDFVLADAQDGSGTNNANFSAPADGGNGRMQMFLWNAVPTLTVNTPATIAGQYEAVESNFSTANKLITTGPKTGQVVYYNDNVAGTTHEACGGAPANVLSGKIALINRGNCNFTVKVKNAQNAGAIAVIMVNNVQGNPITMGGTDNTITIPAVMISITDGFLLANQLANNLNVTLAVGQSPDGDVDNGVVAHEFTHGISNRLTGGPSQSSCLSNSEQMGEGWSDYFALMVTQNWATSNVNTGFLTSRGIGTYVIGQSPTGLGIRTQKYSTDMDINNRVYTATLNNVSPHDKGEIWCAALWDMTWNIIQQVNSINPNIYDASGAGGNAIALKLVMEGMKLQPCSPGFIDGRNAILKADSILYGGVYNCAIREAFRRRGMGLNASQGSSSSVTDQVPDYTPYVTVKKSQNITQVPEGQNIVYTNSVTSCSPATNYVLRDTLPANVTYVSGGTYDAATRVVSFPVNFTAGETQTFSFTVQVNAGSYFAPQTLIDEQVTGSTIPAALTAVSTTANTWSVSTTQSQSAPNAFFTPNAAVASDQKLETTSAVALGTGTSSLSFAHSYNTQAGFDGGVVEISTDNGTTWTDLGNRITAGYYNSSLATGSGNPIAGRQAWSGNSTSFIRSSVNLSSFAGQSAKLRFRFGSNSTTAGTGWYVDDILLKREAVVNMRTSLFNNSGTRVSYSDTVTKIIEVNTCTSVTLTAQPANTTVCAGNDATFSVSVDGTTPGYQWQVSTDGGATYNNLPGATNATLTLTGVTASMNNNRYRVIISNSCPSSITSQAVILTANTPAGITAQPNSVTACEGAGSVFSVNASGNANTYQWQVSTDGGTTFTNISGATGTPLSLTGVTASQNGYQYHVVITSCTPAPLTSANAILTVSNLASITAQPANIPACTGGSATFSVTASGSSLIYQWQVSTDGGASYADIPAATSATLVLTPVTSGMNNNRYRVNISNSCASSVTSNGGILTVSDPASLTSQPSGSTVCEGGNTSFSATATGTNISYQWQVSTDGGATFTDISGATTATLTLNSITPALNNNRYRVVLFSCSATGLNSNAAILTVNSLASISSQPAGANVCTGANAVFTVTAGGSNISYQWLESTDGGATYNNITGATGATLTLTNVTALMNNNRYKVTISNACPSSVTSAEAVLNVTGNASIAAQPTGTTVCEGQTAVFSAIATGSAYQWQVSTDGGTTYSDITGAIGTTLNLTSVTSSMSGNRYRLVVSGCTSTGLNSDVVTLTVNSQAGISAQPANSSACAGNSASFSITASGTSPSYQWEVSTDGGATFAPVTGATAATLQLTGITAAMNNNQYRVIVSNSCTTGLTSAAAILTVNDQAVINSQPAATSVCPGSSAVFSVTASGPGLTYQWQMSNNGGTSFTDLNGETNVTLTISPVTAAMNNNQYRAVVFSSCAATGNASGAGVLTVLPEAQITLQPTDFSGCAGATATFGTTVNGNNISYQWQVSTDGGNTYTNLAGENNAGLTLNNINLSMNNYRYRAVVGATPCGSITNSGTLIVQPSPVVVVTAGPYTSLYPGLTTTLTATSTPPGSSYNWFKNGVLIPGISGNTITVRFEDRGAYNAKDLAGCDNLSNTLSITDSATTTVFIYPNPNNGQFLVQYYSASTSTQQRNITLYDAKGARVYSKMFSIAAPYEKMEVILKKMASGTYLLTLSDQNGKKLATAKVVKF